jgi:hypothetical protein
LSYNGSGTFNINTAGQPVVTGTVISSTAFNALTADLATGLSTAITKNGQTTITANIPWNNFKLTGLGVATTTGDALSYGQAATVTSLTATTGINGIVGNVTPAAATVTTLIASADSSFTSTGAVQLSSGTTGQRPAGVAGKLRFNSTTSEFEGYNGSAWASVGGSAISNDTATATNLYPAFLSATTGTALNIYTSNAKLLYKPSTGELASTVLNATNGLVVNSQTVAESYTVATGNSAMSAGPITISGGVTVTLSGTARWVVS